MSERVPTDAEIAEAMRRMKARRETTEEKVRRVVDAFMQDCDEVLPSETKGSVASQNPATVRQKEKG